MEAFCLALGARLLGDTSEVGRWRLRLLVEEIRVEGRTAVLRGAMRPWQRRRGQPAMGPQVRYPDLDQVGSPRRTRTGRYPHAKICQLHRWEPSVARQPLSGRPGPNIQLPCNGVSQHAFSAVTGHHAEASSRDEPEDLRDGVLRWTGLEHGHAVKLEVALLHDTLALPGQLPQHRTEVLALLPVQGLAPILGNPDDMLPTLPLGVG